MLTLTLSRPQISQGCVDEYEQFAELVESLSDAEWDMPTRCEGFLVRDVAGHVIGLAEDTAAGVPGSRNAELEAASVRGDAPRQAAARLRTALGPITALLDAVDDNAWAGPVAGLDLTLGEGVLTLWYDAFVHADDIRAAIGRPSEFGPGLEASVAYLASELTKKDYEPATLALAGVNRYDVSGGGAAITGDPLQFVLVATGRADAATMGLPPEVNIY